MPLKTFVGPNVNLLMRQAQRVLGPDAVVLHVRRVRTADGPAFQVAAADPATATRQALIGPRRGIEPAMETMTPGLVEGVPFVLAVVGPTGAGKTTTIAKLATHPRVFGGRRVGVLSLDTYRVGAVEQLSIYAEIARVPLAVVYDSQDLDRARKALGECEVILVDTPGRSPKSRRDRDAVRNMLEELAPTETHLVVPSMLTPHAARALAVDFRIHGGTHLLATKTDEAPDDNGIFDLAVELGFPMRWVTDGQEVPFDLQSAAEAIAAARFGQLAEDTMAVGL